MISTEETFQTATTASMTDRSMFEHLSQKSSGDRRRRMLCVDADSFDYFTSAESGGIKLGRGTLWLLTLISSIIVGLVKGGVSWTVESLRNLRLGQMSDTGSIFASMGIMLGFCVVSGLISAILVMFVSPVAGGGGIPDIKAYLNGNLIRDFLSFPALIVRLMGVCLVTSCGVLAGPEGPMAHVGMILTVLVPKWIFQCLSATKLNQRDVFDMATIGSGIGISSAFTAPITGTLFALEEAATYWHPELISRALFGAIVAAIVGEYTSAGFRCVDGEMYCVSVWGEFSFTLEAFVQTHYRPWEIPLFLVEGALVGIVAVGLSFSFIFFARIQPTRYRLMYTCLMFGGSAVLLSLVTLAGVCEPSSGISLSSVSSFPCVSSSNSLATVLLDSPQTAIRTLFTAPKDTAGMGLGSLAIAFFVASTALCMMCGLPVPAGQFIPLVTIGALFGRFFGSLVPANSPGVYAIAGAGGLLAGVSRMTTWIAVVMIESTAQIELTIPIVLSVIASKIVADFFMPHALYERLIERKGIRFLAASDDPSVKERLKDRSVGDVMTTHVVVLYEVETVERIQTVLVRTPFNIFPILSSEECVVGTVSRATLLEALATRDHIEGIVELPRNGPITVSRTTSFEMAYHLFVHLGLAVLLVTDDYNRLAGIITRDNLC